MSQLTKSACSCGFQWGEDHSFDNYGTLLYLILFDRGKRSGDGKGLSRLNQTTPILPHVVSEVLEITAPGDIGLQEANASCKPAVGVVLEAFQISSEILR